MLQRKPYLLVLTVLIFSYLFAHPANACTCGELKPCEAYAGADTVFVGLAQKTKFEPAQGSLPPNAMSTTSTNGSPVTHLSVEEIFRGTNAKEIEISGGGTTCDYHFDEGQRYLVYASRSSDGKYLYTSICSGTSLLSKATKHLVYLRDAKNLNVGGTFQGHVYREYYNPLKNSWGSSPLINVAIIIESEKNRFRSLSNKQGKFIFHKLPGGHYKVYANSQVNFSNIDGMAKEPKSEWEFDIPDHGCIGKWFTARPDGEISGHIIGTPLKNMEIQIMFADQKKAEATEFFSTGVEKDGNFKFSFLPSGKYFIGINMRSGPFLDYPYSEFYYPNVTERAKASAITLRENQKLAGIKLPLPFRVPEREITGIAVWPDGRLAADVYIELRNPRTGWREGNSVVTDSLGHFTIIGMEGQTYKLSALVKKGIPLVNSKPRLITVKKENKPVKLIIELP